MRVYAIHVRANVRSRYFNIISYLRRLFIFTIYYIMKRKIINLMLSEKKKKLMTYPPAFFNLSILTIRSKYYLS